LVSLPGCPAPLDLLGHIADERLELLVGYPVEPDAAPQLEPWPS
jgi:hypothetical protein